MESASEPSAKKDDKEHLVPKTAKEVLGKILPYTLGTDNDLTKGLVNNFSNSVVAYVSSLTGFSNSASSNSMKGAFDDLGQAWDKFSEGMQGTAASLAKATVLKWVCLIPCFDGALYSQEWKEALWARFYTAAPQRQRQSVEQYKIVKRA